MTKEINDAEFRGVTSLDAAGRYSHFVRQISDFEEVWGLRTPSGWVLMGDDDGRQVIPVWPHRRYAQAFISDAWADAEAVPIDLREWLQRWLPGMTRDGHRVAVFPIVNETGQRGTVVAPEKLQRDLEQELGQYESHDG